MREWIDMALTIFVWEVMLVGFFGQIFAVQWGIALLIDKWIRGKNDRKG